MALGEEVYRCPLPLHASKGMKMCVPERQRDAAIRRVESARECFPTVKEMKSDLTHQLFTCKMVRPVS